MILKHVSVKTYEISLNSKAEKCHLISLLLDLLGASGEARSLVFVWSALQGQWRLLRCRHLSCVCCVSTRRIMKLSCNRTCLRHVSLTGRWRWARGPVPRDKVRRAVQGSHPGGGKRDSLQEKRILRVRVSPRGCLQAGRWPRPVPFRVLIVGFVSENDNSNPFSIDQIGLAKQTNKSATQVRTIALITVNPPEFLEISSSFHLYSIQHRSPVLDSLCPYLAILSLLPVPAAPRPGFLCRLNCFDHHLLLLTRCFHRTGRSMIPARGPSSRSRTIYLLRPRQNRNGWRTIGGCEAPGLRSMQSLTEALFSDAHRSLRITPVAKATSWGGSSWDESDSDSETEIVGKIHKSDAPWFNVDELYVSGCLRRRYSSEVSSAYGQVRGETSPGYGR
jgi:hypothetical protein